MNNVGRRVGFRCPTSSKLDIEAWNSELTEVYVRAIGREVHWAAEKVATQRRFQSMVACG
jgi:hypothetical protein